MSSVLALSDRIHGQALEVSAHYKRAEAELIEILQQVEKHRVFIRRGHSSLFSYVTKELGLSESTAYSLITVARKARQVPELKAEIRSGRMTLSNARRVASVLTAENKKDWIQAACELSSRQLEKEIVKVCPQEAIRERATYTSKDRVKLELGLSEREMLKLRRVQDLLSQSKKRPVSLEETIAALTSEFLTRHDPVEKAKRHQVKKGPENGRDRKQVFPKRLVTRREEMDTGQKVSGLPATPVAAPIVTQRRPVPSQHKTTSRESIPAAILHQVNLRDQRKCMHILADGTHCNQSRWIEVHHKIAVSQGGPNTFENLITLCSTHHKFWHLRSAR